MLPLTTHVLSLASHLLASLLWNSSNQTEFKHMKNISMGERELLGTGIPFIHPNIKKHLIVCSLEVIIYTWFDTQKLWALITAWDHFIKHHPKHLHTVYLSFIQHKIHATICNPYISISSWRGTRTSFKDIVFIEFKFFETT